MKTIKIIITFIFASLTIILAIAGPADGAGFLNTIWTLFWTKSLAIVTGLITYALNNKWGIVDSIEW